MNLVITRLGKELLISPRYFVDDLAGCCGVGVIYDFGYLIEQYTDRGIMISRRQNKYLESYKLDEKEKGDLIKVVQYHFNREFENNNYNYYIFTDINDDEPFTLNDLCKNVFRFEEVDTFLNIKTSNKVTVYAHSCGYTSRSSDDD